MYPNSEVRVRNYEVEYENQYASQRKFRNGILVGGIITMVIALFGLVGYTSDEVNRRRKEIAIRKVMGSSVGSVVSLFALRYAVPLVVAFVIAAPIGWWLSNSWLQSFAEHTPIYWWLFPLSFVGVSAVVVLTVVAQSWRVATENPVESIKTE